MKTKRLLPFVSFTALLLLFAGCQPVLPIFKANYASDYETNPRQPRRPELTACLSGDTLHLALCVYTNTLKPDSTRPGGPVWNFGFTFEWFDSQFHTLAPLVTRSKTLPLLTPWIPDTLWLHFRLKTDTAGIAGAILTSRFTDSTTGTNLDSWTTILPDNYPILEGSGLIPLPRFLKTNTALDSHLISLEICTHCPLKIPTPPFASDSLPQQTAPSWQPFTVPSQGEYTLGTSGLFRLSNSLSGKKAFVLVASHDFPRPKAEEEGLLAIRYITTSDEFRQLMLSGSLMHPLSSVWIQQGNQAEQAEERLKQFLTIAEEANRLFSWSQPGSLTDRGMIWIIYGKPDIVWKSPHTETWIYETTENGQPLRFDFDLKPKATGSEWILRRHPQYRTSWNRQVDRWRM